jgi:hypothetical protein
MGGACGTHGEDEKFVPETKMQREIKAYKLIPPSGLRIQHFCPQLCMDVNCSLLHTYFVDIKLYLLLWNTKVSLRFVYAVSEHLYYKITDVNRNADLSIIKVSSHVMGTLPTQCIWRRVASIRESLNTQPQSSVALYHRTQ